MKERLGDRPRRDGSPSRGNIKAKEPERRACHICKVKGHLAYNRPDKGATSNAPKIEMGGGDHPPAKDPDNSEMPPKSTHSDKRADRSRTGRPYDNRGGRGSGRGQGRGGLANNPHMTEGVTCAHCGIRNLTEAQCWTKNKDLRPVKYKPIANLALLDDHQENIENDMKWENEHLAHEQRSKRYELEKDLENNPENSPTDENSERFQFMANFNSPTPEQDSEEQLAEDEQQYNESM